MTTTNKKPLVVDLDGTLIQTDLLIESVLALIKHNLLYVFLLPIWLLKGKAKLKHEIASRVDIDAGLLPYQDKFLEYLKAEHANGRRLILATASNEKFAHSIAHHLGIFADVLASDDQTNLSGQHKLEGLQRALGNQDFVYAANAMVDLRVWEGADSAVLVNPEPGVIEAVQDHVENPLVFETPDLNSVKNYIKALRFHQWLKNFLIFIPLLMAHKFYDLQLLSQVFLGFIAFGLCASSVYLLNDLLDLADDRQHPTKRHRPFAAGTISILKGTLLIPVLLIAAFGLSLLLPLEFTGILALYYAITIAYSLYLKRFAPIDILTLAGLYTIRVIAGAAAVSIMPSFWLLAFSMFVFLSLALVKRFTELLKLQHQHQTTTRGRGYSTIDLHTLAQFGSASAYTAVLVLALYINSDDVRKLYSHPELIWMLCPLVLYLMTRIWLLVHRGELDEDPVVFVIRDRHSLWLVMIGAVLLWLAI